MSKKAAGKVARGRRRSSRSNADDATDARVERSKARVLRTTSGLLIAKGLSGVSVDEIARRSGVAKTTIYGTGARARNS
jgi:AcrR family transcriptional regulator